MAAHLTITEAAELFAAKKLSPVDVVDAVTGAVLSTKQFGGARGLAGWVRESFDHKKNTP